MHIVKEIKNYGFTNLSIVRIDGSFFIKKELTIDKFPFRELFNNEINMMKFMNHKNIISMKTYNKNYFIMEYAGLGDLKELIAKNAKRVINKRDYYLSKILDGIKFLHSNNIIHNDLKLSNIFITKDDKVKIGDFALSTTIKSDFFSKLPDYIFQGTYSLNKKDNNQVIDKSNDIYSLAIIIFELYTFKDPSFSNLDYNFIEDLNIRKLFKKIISNDLSDIELVMKEFKSYKKRIF